MAQYHETILYKYTAVMSALSMTQLSISADNAAQIITVCTAIFRRSILDLRHLCEADPLCWCVCAQAGPLICLAAHRRSFSVYWRLQQLSSGSKAVQANMFV